MSAEYADDEDFHAAKTKMNDLLEMGKSSNACVKSAQASIEAVLKDVVNAQRMLNRLDDGSGCATTDQHKIDRAKRNLLGSKMQVKASHGDLTKKESQTVKGTYASFKNACGAFYQTSNWRVAHDSVVKAGKMLTSMKQKKKDADAALARAIKNAKEARRKCRCRVLAKTAQELKTAESVTTMREKTIIRETLLICLVHARAKGKKVNQVANKCKGQKIKTSYKSKLTLYRTKLAAGVMGTDCGKGGFKGVLFQANGNSAVYKNSWRGWYEAGHTGNKKSAYDDQKISGLRFEAANGFYAEYKLNAGFKGKTLLDIVKKCMPAQCWKSCSNTNKGKWKSSPNSNVGGHCRNVGTVVRSNGIQHVESLRLGVGDGDTNGDARDWSLFMPVRTGKGDYKGAKVFCFGGEDMCNNNYSGSVTIKAI